MSGGVKHQALAEILLWWVLTTAVWLATLTSFTAAEISVAVACTLPCAVAAQSAAEPIRAIGDSVSFGYVGLQRYCTTYGANYPSVGECADAMVSWWASHTKSKKFRMARPPLR